MIGFKLKVPMPVGAMVLGDTQNYRASGVPNAPHICFHTVEAPVNEKTQCIGPPDSEAQDIVGEGMAKISAPGLFSCMIQAVRL